MFGGSDLVPNCSSWFCDEKSIHLSQHLWVNRGKQSAQRRKGAQGRMLKEHPSHLSQNLFGHRCP